MKLKGKSTLFYWQLIIVCMVSLVVVHNRPFQPGARSTHFILSR